MCLLIETIRVDDGKVHFAEYHQQRVDRSVGVGNICLEQLISELELPAVGCFKLRITYTAERIVAHEIEPYIDRQIRTLRLVTDDTIRYDRKLSDRSALEALRDMRGECDDILIVRNGLITDSSYANVALFDGNSWVTPAEPLLAGTCRARLIDQGIITPRQISAASLGNYSKLTLINAMIGFDPNRLYILCGTSIPKSNIADAITRDT